MSALSPDLFARRYDDLVEIGRARLPGLAPEWTDHNAHDPGITLIELLAWVVEAQLYSLSRMRRDERRAYAALMGVTTGGAQPARGTIWPVADDPDGPANTLRRAIVFGEDAEAGIVGAATPVFRLAAKVLWMPARIDRLQTRLKDGRAIDHLAANRRGGPAFAPLGSGDGVLKLGLAATGWSPILQEGRPADARIAIGVLADAPRADGRGEAGRGVRSPLSVRMVTDDGDFPLRMVEDGTRGLLQSGVILLDPTAVEGEPTAATLEISAPGGAARAPRLLRIEPNVLPVVQRQAVEERHDADGSPDQAFDLETPGISYAAGAEPVSVAVEGEAEATAWTLVERLADCGPGDRAFAFDRVAARVRFGNGLNGAVPPAGAKIVSRYLVCEGVGGNFAASRRWRVRGFDGVFGTNPEAFTGGADAPGSGAERSAARAALREGHALVSAADVEAAARALPGLEVARAWVPPPSAGDLAAGTLRLVAMQARGRGGEPAEAPETPRWLEAVRAALAPRMLLGTRLRVTAPRYVGFSIGARIEAEPRIDPKDARAPVVGELARRLRLVAGRPGGEERAFGRPLTRRDLAAWIEALPDVRRVISLEIRPEAGGTAETLPLPRTGLPRIDLAGSAIELVRGGTS
jgi:hypothetical protein